MLNSIDSFSILTFKWFFGKLHTLFLKSDTSFTKVWDTNTNVSWKSKSSHYDGINYLCYLWAHKCLLSETKQIICDIRNSIGLNILYIAMCNKSQSYKSNRWCLFGMYVWKRRSINIIKNKTNSNKISNNTDILLFTPYSYSASVYFLPNPLGSSFPLWYDTLGSSSDPQVLKTYFAVNGLF